jgi:hypothetical protein
VVEARGAKTVAQTRVQTFVLAEDDPRDDSFALACEPGGE